MSKYTKLTHGGAESIGQDTGDPSFLRHLVPPPSGCSSASIKWEGNVLLLLV